MTSKSSRRSDRRFPRARLRLEILEDRLAPATLVDAMDVTYLDAKGNQVNIHASLPLFNAATVNSVLLFNTGSVNGDNSRSQQLQEIDLTKLGTAAEGTSLSVVPQNAPTDLADVGLINAGGIDLGLVKIQGDLGAITAGSGSSTVAAVASLVVVSIGRAVRRRRRPAGIWRALFRESSINSPWLAAWSMRMSRFRAKLVP